MAKRKRLNTASSVYSFYDGDDLRLDGLFFGQETPLKTSRISGMFYGRDNPISVETDIAKARYWFEHNAYVRGIIGLRASFYNYRFQIDLSNPAVRKWAERKVGSGRAKKTNLQIARRFTHDFWQEWLTVDSAASTWLTSNPRPRLIPPEYCHYTDIFGIESLAFKPQDLGISADAMKILPGLTPQERAALSVDELVLTRQSNLFDFEVVKRAMLGSGFGRPALKTVLSTCAQHESMEVRDTVLAGAGRLVMEHIKQGHEIKGGSHAGSKTHFNTDAKSRATANALKNKTGHLRFVSNFDVDFSWGNYPVDQFNAKKYEGTLIRLAWWAMPLGQMLAGASLNPTLLGMLRSAAIEDRDTVHEFIKTIFVRCMGAPEDIEFGWGERCFLDPRAASDLLKFGLAGAGISQKTYLDNLDLDQGREWERKDEEKKQKKHRTQPIYDPHHGPMDVPGRKPGTADGQGE